MRVTNYMTQQRSLEAIRSNQEMLARAQEELSTGRRVNTLSDDPATARRLMHIDGMVRDLEQFRRNGVSATTRLSAEDNVLTSFNDVLSTAKGLTVSAATANPTDPERQVALATAIQLRNQIVALGNTKVGGEYILAGGNTTIEPFPPSGIYQGDSTARSVEIDDGAVIPVNHTGDQFIAPAIQAIDGLITALTTGTASDIQASVGALNAAQQQGSVAQAEVGSRMSVIKDTGEALGRKTGELLIRRDSEANADPAESAVRVISAQSQLERAYAAVAKVMQTSLMDFLR
jgi:flagellar hook-associated protein 3 FlgL